MDDARAIEQAPEESFVFLADSRLRDRVAYPTPSEYEISFNAPFRNVVGVDLLDATIPRAEYQVEATSNSVRFAVTDDAGVETWHTVEIQPGDYNLPQLCDVLDQAFADATPTLQPIVVQPASDPYERTNKLLFSRSHPFKFDMASSTMRYILGFGNPVVDGNQDYDPDPTWRPYETRADDIFVARSVATIQKNPAVLGPAVALPNLGSTVDSATALRQRFLAMTSGPVTNVLVNAQVVDQGTLFVSVVRVATGTVVSTGQTAVFQDYREPTTVSMTSSEDIVAGDEYAVVFETASATVSIKYAPVNMPDLSDAIGRIDTRINGTWFSANLDAEQLCVTANVSESGYQMLSPGVVQLTGERYVVVRCPEIESHLYRDRASERFHSGMGVVKLTGYGYNEQRYDFLSFPARKFHPIGKVRKLTIRIEKPDGTLYDSHGVDNLLMFVIRYRTAPAAPVAAAPVAAGPVAASTSTQNPAYSGDYRQYMIDELGRRVERAQRRPPSSFGATHAYGASGRI